MKYFLSNNLRTTVYAYLVTVYVHMYVTVFCNNLLTLQLLRKARVVERTISVSEYTYSEKFPLEFILSAFLVVSTCRLLIDKFTNYVLIV